MKKCLFLGVMIFLLGGILWINRTPPRVPEEVVGKPIDSWRGIPVYSNGPRPHDTFGQSLAPDGYVYGWKYQCVEFIKRYYFTRFHHRMPEGQGNARDYWQAKFQDGQLNSQRGLTQFSVPSASQIHVEDILVYTHAPYGHVALVTDIRSDSVFIIQQNVGTKTRDTLFLVSTPAGFRLSDRRIRGWLRHPNAHVF